MVIKVIKSGKQIPCSKAVWDSIIEKNKSHLFEIIQEDEKIKPLMSLRKSGNKNKND